MPNVQENQRTKYMPGDVSTSDVVLEKLINLTHALSAELSLPSLYDQIIAMAQEVTNADGGTLYILQDVDNKQQLSFEVIRNVSLGIHAGGANSNKPPVAPIDLWLSDGSSNNNNVCAHVFHKAELVNIADVYEVQDFDFSGARAFDKQMSYRTKSLLTMPLQNHLGEIIGVLQLINAQKPGTNEVIAFNPELIPLVKALASTAAVTLNKQQLIEAHKELLNSFIQAIAKAIDEKSKHTSAHCQRIPILMELFAQAACDSTAPAFKDFNLNADEWYELQVASWLHDCGKLSTPDTLLDKSTKLYLLSDDINAVQARFAALIGQIRSGTAPSTSLDLLQGLGLEQQVAQLQADCEFIVKANTGGEFMTQEDQDRVRAIAKYQWFDFKDCPQSILAPEETDMLCISRGTLNAEERAQINRHINVTIDILESLPFPKNLQRVPEYAGGHHEKIDGSGYPRGLTGDQMSIPARMMAICDIFEALTAKDRPYKNPMPLSQALSILRNMKNDNQIDADLYELFVQERVWEIYGKNQLLPEQLDIADAAEYL